ncbi:MAG: FCD domain-containing protein [Bacteroidales bacterium]|nr:FCD domain-containing protein [Bacteroidales bacterium]
MNTMDTSKDFSLVEQTQKKILEYIAQNGCQMNSHLPKEKELVDILGVSRVVVREALSHLRAIGFLKTKRKMGTVVVVPKIFGVLKVILASGMLDRDALRDLYALRLMLEIGMADFAFKCKTDAYLQKLAEIAKYEDETMDTEESIALDIKFHSCLYSMVGNNSLSDFQHLLGPLFALYAPRAKDYKVKQIVSHAGLVEVLRTGTPDSFRMAMRLHLNTQFENMEKILDKTDKAHKGKAQPEV